MNDAPGDFDPKFFADLNALAGKFDFEVKMRDAGLLHIYNLYGSDVFLALELDKSNLIVAFFTFRTSSWHYDGERTDLHDCLSILFSISCAVQQKSISLWDIQNEWTEIEEELYGRYATVTQPNLSILPQDDSGLVKLDELFTLYRLYLSFLGLYFSHSSKSPKYAWDLPHIHLFREKVALSIAAKTDDVVVVERCRPDWTYLQIYKHGIAALKSPLVRPLLGSLLPKTISERDELTDNLITYLKARDTRHCFGSQEIKLVCELTKFLSEDSVQFLASESHLFLLSGDWLVSQRGDFGQERFNEERQNFSLAVRRKINFLYENSPLHWNQDGSPSRFEDLCRELLGREPTVQRVRKVSPTMQPDQGRDLIAEIVSYVPVDIPVAKDAQPVHITKYVVQCKYAHSTLGIPNGAGPYEVLYLGDYTGYFLITNSTISSSLTSLLEKIRSDKKYTADWWTRDEVEERLKTHPDLLEKYSDLVSYTPFNGKVKRNRRQAKNGD